MPRICFAPKAAPSSALCLLLFCTWLGLGCARCGGGTRDTRRNTAPAQAITCKEAAGVRVCGDAGVVDQTTIQSTGKHVVPQ